MSPFLCLLALLASLQCFVHGASQPTLPRPADPFADPRHDPYNPLKYIASNALTAVAFSEFLAWLRSSCISELFLLGLVLLVALAQSICMKKWGAKWMLAMTIGAYSTCI